jgi:hypothetical protein
VPKDKSGGSCAWSGELAEFGQCAFLPKAIKSTTEQSTNKEACGKLPSAKVPYYHSFTTALSSLESPNESLYAEWSIEQEA